MRTTKRFTPKVLARFERMGRSLGTREQYSGWHQVTRGDPASSGRSHVVRWRERLRDLLSDGEFDQQLFATMLPNLDDCLEQFKLDCDSSVHPLAAYGEHDPFSLHPGTTELAQALGIKPPKVYGGGNVAPWSLSTDLVLVFKHEGRPRDALALAFKPADFSAHQRVVELLRLEREYWMRRGVPWMLITSGQSDRAVRMTLRRIAAWTLDEDAAANDRATATRIAIELPGHSLSTVLWRIAESVGSLNTAQRALWQSIWRGELPIDLRRDWRPHRPLQLVTRSHFMDFNPIAVRRSAWI